MNQPDTDALAMTTSLKLSLQRCCNRFVALGLVCFVVFRRGRGDEKAEGLRTKKHNKTVIATRWIMERKKRR